MDRTTDARARTKSEAKMKVKSKARARTKAKGKVGARARTRARTKTRVRSKATPKGSAMVVVFTCSWYPAIAADNAGVLGYEYTDDSRIVTLACAGQITPAVILDAFGAGAQGVLVAACKPELCHYVNGSSNCEKVVEETRKLAVLLGIGGERVGLEFFDSEDAERFAKRVDEFHDAILKLNPIMVDSQGK